nr:glycosyltransferase family 1 protein [Jiella sp. LLJ827]
MREIAAFRLRPQRYFIFVGAVEPKKNIERLIDAYLSTGSRYPLVIVGKLGWDYERVVEKIESAAPLFSRRKAPPRQRIIHLPYLPFFQMLSLVENARAMLFPSLYEGFGLPVLEAMLLGTPVVAANTSSLPEVVGEAGLLADPYDSMAIGQAIRMIDHDDDLRAELSRRGPEQAAQFSPERYSERVKALYDELL